jgi:hypothetical protein
VILRFSDFYGVTKAKGLIINANGIENVSLKRDTLNKERDDAIQIELSDLKYKYHA